MDAAQKPRSESLVRVDAFRAWWPTPTPHGRCVTTEHYHVERNHQGIDNKLIDDPRSTTSMIGGIERRERLGGMLNYYHRRAA